MPAARNQEVTVRRPWASSTPSSRTGTLAAERLSSQWPSSRKKLPTKAGRCDNAMAGSLTRGSLSKGHRVPGAGLRPPSCSSNPHLGRPTWPAKTGSRSRKVELDGDAGDSPMLLHAERDKLLVLLLEMVQLVEAPGAAGAAAASSRSERERPEGAARATSAAGSGGRLGGGLALARAAWAKRSLAAAARAEADVRQE